MATPWTYDDTLRVHDEAVHNWLGGLLIDYGALKDGTLKNQFPIVRVFSSPNQAFATIPDLLVHLGWIQGTDAPTMRKNAFQDWPIQPLPFACIERGEPVMDPEQAGNIKDFRRKHFNPVTGDFEFHRWPRHMSTRYKVTFVSTKRYSEAFIREWVYGSMGPVGCWQNERLIPVVHPAPWGTILQRWRLESSTDLSQLETEDQRLIRFEFEFSLRTLVFVPIISTVGEIDFEGFQYETMPEGYGITTDQTTIIQTPDDFNTRSSNLYIWGKYLAQAIDAWPTAGAATATLGTRTPQPNETSLRIGVTTSSDSVPFLEHMNRLDTGGKVILSISFKYISSGGVVDLRASSHNATTDVVSEVFRRALPASIPWAPVHVFTLANSDSSIVDIVGTGAAVDLQASEIDVRQVYDGTRMPYNASVTAGGSNYDYMWEGLENRPYLVVGVFTPSTGTTTVTCWDDEISPVNSQVQVIDQGHSVGFVFLMQPKMSSIKVRAPAGLTVDSLYLQRYDGPYDGNTV